MPVKKPPIGIMPRDIWLDERQRNLIAAIDRYIEAGVTVPIKWVEEYNEIIKLKEESQ